MRSISRCLGGVPPTQPRILVKPRGKPSTSLGYSAAPPQSVYQMWVLSSQSDTKCREEPPYADLVPRLWAGGLPHPVFPAKEGHARLSGMAPALGCPVSLPLGVSPQPVTKPGIDALNSVRAFWVIGCMVQRTLVRHGPGQRGLIGDQDRAIAR